MNIKEAYKIVTTHPYFDKIYMSGDKPSRTNDYQSCIFWGYLDDTDNYYMESGSWCIEDNAFYHNTDFDVYGKTFDECLIKLAEKVIDEYGEIKSTDFYEDIIPVKEIIGKDICGNNVEIIISVEFNWEVYATYRRYMGLEV